LGKQIGFALLSGFGLGNTLQPSLIAVQAGVERKHMAIVTSFRNFIRNLGGTLGLALSGTIINNAIRATLTPHGISRSSLQLLLNTPDLFRDTYGEDRTNTIRAELASAYAKGFKIIFIVSAVLNSLAFVAAWFLIPQIELSKKDDAMLREEGKKRHAEKDMGSGRA
jgi:predicted MFS family arabinose efflux permease